MMNIANMLTILRFILVGIFVFVFYSPIINSNQMAATAVFLISGVTDILDGYIARKYNMITDWGKLMDPLADKIMSITVLICLYDKNIIPKTTFSLFIIAIVIIKELLLITGAAFLFKKRNIVVQSNYYGKAATVLFYIAVVVLIFRMKYAELVLILAVLLALLALVQYGRKNFKTSKGQ